MKKVYFDKISISAFSISLISVLIPVLFCCGYFLTHYLTKNSLEYLKEKNSQINVISKTIGNEFDALREIGTGFLYQKWVTRYTNNIDLYEEDFNLFSKRDISETISTKSTTTPYLDDIYIVIPSKKTIVSPNGWFSLDEFVFLNPEISFDNIGKSGEPYSIVKSSDEKKVVLSYVNEFLPDPNCCVSFAIDKVKLDKYVKSLSLGQFEDVRVTFDSEMKDIAKTTTDGESEMLSTSKKNSDYGLTFNFSYLSYNAVIEAKEITNMFIASLILLVLSVVASMIITITISSPLHKLIKSITNQRFSSAKQSCEYLSEYLLRMHENNHTLASALDEYRRISKSEMIFNMLTDEGYKYNQEMILSIFPWITYNYPFKIILMQQMALDLTIPRQEVIKLVEDEFSYSYIFENITYDIVAIVWDKTFDSCQEFERQMRKNMTEQWYFASSEEKTHLSSLHECYIDVNHQLITLMGKSEPELVRISISQEIQLINAIIYDEQQKCLNILNSIHAEFMDNIDICEYIGKLLERIANEYAVPQEMEKVSGSTNAQLRWQQVINECIAVCRRIHSEKKKSSSDTASLIKNYIDDNYSNPEMSLKLLSEVFSIDVSMLSKIYKSNFDINFSEYLLNLRITKAKELLLNSSENIASIAQKVGYINYLSFKRAFIRMIGLSPKEFKDKAVAG